MYSSQVLVSLRHEFTEQLMEKQTVSEITIIYSIQISF